MQRLLPVTILVLGLIQLGLLLVIGLSPAPENATSLAHASFSGMRIGGDGAARLEPVAGAAFVFQLVVLAQICCLVALGVGKHRHSGSFHVLLVLAFLVAAGVWYGLFSAYETFLETGTTAYFLGFPVATAWQVYAIWLSGLVLVGTYVFGFTRFIWSEEDETRFQTLVTRARTGGGDN
ncbi:MAG: hypothetical protein ACFHX7_17525 [Pseudomonadota bacterium]